MTLMDLTPPGIPFHKLFFILVSILQVMLDNTGLYVQELECHETRQHVGLNMMINKHQPVVLIAAGRTGNGRFGSSCCELLHVNYQALPQYSVPVSPT